MHFFHFARWCSQVLYSSLVYKPFAFSKVTGNHELCHCWECWTDRGAYVMHFWCPQWLPFPCSGSCVPAQGGALRVSGSSPAVSVKSPIKWMSKSAGKHTILQSPSLYFQPSLSAASQREDLKRWHSLKSYHTVLEGLFFACLTITCKNAVSLCVVGVVPLSEQTLFVGRFNGTDIWRRSSIICTHPQWCVIPIRLFPSEQVFSSQIPVVMPYPVIRV